MDVHESKSPVGSKVSKVVVNLYLRVQMAGAKSTDSRGSSGVQAPYE